MGKNRSPRSNRNTRVLNVNLLTSEREKLIYTQNVFKSLFTQKQNKSEKLIFFRCCFCSYLLQLCAFCFQAFFWLIYFDGANFISAINSIDCFATWGEKALTIMSPQHSCISNGEKKTTILPITDFLTFFVFAKDF